VIFRDRASIVKGIIYSHCNDIIVQSPSSIFEVNQSRKHSETGTIAIETTCLNDSSIKILEEINNGNIVKYSYLYESNNGFFFNYGNDGDSNGIKKPLHHLHVGITKHANNNLIELLPSELIEHGGPHYKVSEISINDFMCMIIVNYFNDHKNHDKMIENLGFQPKAQGGKE
jgi:hypothetical protein